MDGGAARLAVSAGHDVVLGNRRGPQTLAEAAEGLQEALQTERYRDR